MMEQVIYVARGGLPREQQAPGEIAVGDDRLEVEGERAGDELGRTFADDTPQRRPGAPGWDGGEEGETADRMARGIVLGDQPAH
ncbi:hypothetical protein D3C72_1940590 [compost metagenome]